MSILRILNMDIANRINERLEALNLKGVDITKATGVSSGGVSQWRNGITTPAAEKVFSLSRLLKCDPEWLITGKTVEKREIAVFDPFTQPEGVVLNSSGLGETATQPGYYNIPIYDVELAAGHSGFFDNEYPGEVMSISTDYLDRNSVPPSSASIVTVKGESMMPTLFNNDTILLDLSTTKPVSNKIFAFNFDGDLRVKRFIRQLDTTWRIVSDNEDKELYRDEILSHSNVERLKIIGRVASVIERTL
jgi:phage repressor protein C with HTH and peptisase S24 domain